MPKSAAHRKLLIGEFMPSVRRPAAALVLKVHAYCAPGLNFAADCELRDDEYTDLFDVAPDGKRFLFASLPGKEGDGQNHPIVVVNWFKELEEKMATVKGR